MHRMIFIATLLLVGACNKQPVAGSTDDQSAQGISIRKAVADVDAAKAEAGTPASTH